MKRAMAAIGAIGLLLLLTACSFFAPRARILFSTMDDKTYDVTCTIQNTGGVPIQVGVLRVTWGYPKENGCRAMKEVLFRKLPAGGTITITVQYEGPTYPRVGYRVSLRDLRTW